MKVFLLTDSDAFAGTERHMLELAKAMSELGVTAVIGCPDCTPLSDQAKREGVACRAIARGFGRGVRHLRATLADWGPDLVHAHNGRSSMMAAVAGARRGKRSQLVSTLHFISLARDRRLGLKARLSGVAHRWLDHATNHWIAISDVVAEAAKQRRPNTAPRLTRVHNGIAPHSSDSSREETRRRVGISDETTLLVSAIRLEQEKDAPTLIRAAEILSRKHTNWQWLVAGDGALSEELRLQVLDKWPSKSPLRFLGRRDDVPDLMKAADLFVHPAPAEPFGLVLIEAMAQSTPVVASAGGAAPEIIRDGQTGWLFTPGDAESLAAAISNAVASNEIPRIGQAAAARLQECFTADRMARETLAVYRRVLDELDRSDSSAETGGTLCEFS